MHFYDLDDTIIGEQMLKAGEASFTLRKGTHIQLNRKILYFMNIKQDHIVVRKWIKFLLTEKMRISIRLSLSGFWLS